MSNTATHDSLEIEVSDFGPIVNAKVSLRPLTVFIGPSNTGKSYLSTLIYALHRFFDSLDGHSPHLFDRSLPFAPRDWQPIQPHETYKKLLELGRHITAKDIDSTSTQSIALEKRVANAISSIITEGSENLGKEIRRCFGVSTNQSLTRKGNATSARIGIRQRLFKDPITFEHTLNLAKKTEFKTTIPTDLLIPIDLAQAGQNAWIHLQRSIAILNSDSAEVKGSQGIARDVFSYIGNLILRSSLGVLNSPAYYLPADRTGVMHSHGVVVRALIANASLSGIDRVGPGEPVLSGVLSDFLRQLIYFEQGKMTSTNVGEISAARIEKDVLQGTVKVDRSQFVNYPSFLYRPNGWNHDLGLANASSMVSELAPVVVYLRHLVRHNNVLIVEEPEAHLHPKMQVEFTRMLARLVNDGIRVIVTTHSEWLLEELGNIVKRSELRNSYSDADDVSLKTEQVGVWLFKAKQRPKGSTVKEIRLNEAGFYPSDFDNVAESLHHDSVDIFNRIENGQ